MLMLTTNLWQQLWLYVEIIIRITILNFLINNLCCNEEICQNVVHVRANIGQYDWKKWLCQMFLKINVILNIWIFYGRFLMTKLFLICTWKSYWFCDCCCQHYSSSPTGFIVSSWIWNQIKLILMTLYKTQFWLDSYLGWDPVYLE